MRQKYHRVRVASGSGLWAASVCLFVGGCSLAPVIENNSIDYGTTIEEVSNASLVKNVLRGRDGAPLYFPDLSQIRGSMNASVSTQSTVPWALPNAGTSIAGPFSASTTPSFDIAPSNTKQFYLGILNPISPTIFSYFVERARGYGTFQWIFHLAVSNIEVAELGQQTVTHSWNTDRFVEISDSWFVDKAHGQDPKVMSIEGKPKKFGPPLDVDAKAIVQASAAGLEVVETPDGRMQFQKGANSSSVICFHDGTGYSAISIVRNSSVKGPAGESEPNLSLSSSKACRGPVSRRHYTLHLRSVEQIFNYLGQLVLAQEKNLLIRRTGRFAGCPRIPFVLSRLPTGHVRFSVPYRGAVYYVSGQENRLDCGALDNTLPILAVLNDLLSINRDANEIPTTKGVQAVGG